MSVQKLVQTVQKHFIKSMFPHVKTSENRRLKTMENKKLIIGFVWTFIMTILAVESLKGDSITFVGYMILFFIALGSTVAVETMIPDKKHHGIEIKNEIEDLKLKLNEFTKRTD